LAVYTDGDIFPSMPLQALWQYLFHPHMRTYSSNMTSHWPAWVTCNITKVSVSTFARSSKYKHKMTV